MNGEIGISDLLTAMNCKEDSWGGSWFWLIFLFIIFMLFNGNFFQNRRTEPLDTTDFALNGISRDVAGVQKGVCDSTYALNNTMLNSRFEDSQLMTNGFNSVNSNISQLGYQMQNCCCETQRSIDNVKYENAKNTCDIISAGQANTQRIIDLMTQDKIESLRGELQSAQLALQNNAQTANLIATLRPYPQPAYITCSPYVTSGTFAQGTCGC